MAWPQLLASGQLSGATDALNPGSTVVLQADRSRAEKSRKVYNCYLDPEVPPSGFLVGWSQRELDGGAPCGAEMVEVAVHFDEGPSNQVRAVIEPLLPEVKTGGRPEKHSLAIVDTILYVVRTA